MPWMSVRRKSCPTISKKSSKGESGYMGTGLEDLVPGSPSILKSTANARVCLNSYLRVDIDLYKAIPVRLI